MHDYLLGRDGTTEGTPACRLFVLDPLLSHSMAKPWREALRTKATQQTPGAGTMRASPPGPLNATDQPQCLHQVSSRHEWGTLNSFARTVSAPLRGPRSSCRNGRHCADRSHRPCPCLCHRRYDNPCRRPVAVSVATEFQTNVYVERLGDRYRWSLIHRRGPCPLLRITAMNKWTPQAGCRVWSAAGPWVILQQHPACGRRCRRGRATRGTRGC